MNNWNKVDILPTIPKPDAIYFVLSKDGASAAGYVTDNYGRPIPIADKDLMAQVAKVIVENFLGSFKGVYVSATPPEEPAINDIWIKL